MSLGIKHPSATSQNKASYENTLHTIDDSGIGWRKLGASKPFVTVGSDAGCNYVINGSNNVAQLNLAIANALAGDAIMIVGDDVYFDGDFILDKAISILTPKSCFQDSGAVSDASDIWIRKLTVTNAAASIHNVHLKGFNTHELMLYANGQYLEDFTFENIGIFRDGAGIYKGLILKGDGTTDGWMNNILLNNCHLSNYSGVDDGLTFGIVNFQNTRMLTELRFNHPTLVLSADAGDPQTVFYLQDDADVDSMFLNQPRIINSSNAAPQHIVYVQARTAASTGINIDWQGGRFESHSAYTILAMEWDGDETDIRWRMSGMEWQGGADCTLFNLDVGASGNVIRNFPVLSGLAVDWSHNPFTGSAAPTLGTNFFRSSRVHLILKDNPGLNPIGLAANPFNNVSGATEAICPSGNAAVPVASTDYPIEGADCLITAANSTNSNNAILIKDGKGHTIKGPVSTLATELVFRGQVVNWGAFTGTAGAVSVWFA
jgi:hypothetical protein